MPFSQSINNFALMGKNRHNCRWQRYVWRWNRTKLKIIYNLELIFRICLNGKYIFFGSNKNTTKVGYMTNKNCIYIYNAKCKHFLWKINKWIKNNASSSRSTIWKVKKLTVVKGWLATSSSMRCLVMRPPMFWQNTDASAYLIILVFQQRVQGPVLRT